MRTKVDDFEQQDRTCKVRIASLASQLGNLDQQASQQERQADEQENAFFSRMQELNIAVASLREERAAWQHRIRQFETETVAREKELTDLEEQVTLGVQDRRQMQSECLSLQHECEDARVELQETRDLLRATGNTVERMVRQKLDLEWELQEQSQKHNILRNVLLQEGNKLAHEAEETRRQREEMIASSHKEIEQQRSAAESFRCSAVADQREVAALTSECARLERETATQAAELQRLEGCRRAFEEETSQEHHREGVTREMLERAKAKREEYGRQLAVLEGQAKVDTAEVVDLQEQRAKLLLGRAQRQAARVLERCPASPADFCMPVDSPKGSVSLIARRVPVPTTAAGAAMGKA